MEMDQSIALFVRECREKEAEEEKERIREQYDPKQRITYTLEEMVDGIRRGKMYLYTLRMEFGTKELLSGRITVPYIKDFFDVVEEEEETALLASNKRKVSFNISDTPCKKAVQSFEEWVSLTKEAMKNLHIYIKPEKKAVVGELEYFCYVSPTSVGRLYNVMFRMQKGERICVGALNCMEEEKKGMGLLLEAIVLMIEEMNR